MKKNSLTTAIYLLSLSIILLTSCTTKFHQLGDEKYYVKILDSGKKGPVLLVVAENGEFGNCAHETLRQLQNRKPSEGTVILARSAVSMPFRSQKDDWELMNCIDIKEKYTDLFTLVLKEDFDSWHYTPGTWGEVIYGNNKLAQSCLESINSLPGMENRKWKIKGGEAEDLEHLIVFTTNAKNGYKGGIRPSFRQREMRFAYYGLLKALGMSEGWGEEDIVFPYKKDGITRVAVYDDSGAVNGYGNGPDWLQKKLSVDQNLLVELVGSREIKTGVLNQVDVLVIGGGSATPQHQALGEEGHEAIRKFVSEGGGYYGICAGACVGAGKFLGPDPKRIYPHVKLIPITYKATDIGKKVMLTWNENPVTAAKEELADLSGGPLFLLPEDNKNIKVWAVYKEDHKSGDGKRVLPLGGTPAVISSYYGKGRVVLTSTHNERAPTDPKFFQNAVRWCDSRSPESAIPVKLLN